MAFNFRSLIARLLGKKEASSPAELPWKDYEGETASQLVALKATFREDSLVCAVEEALMSKPDAELSRTECFVLAIESLERQVNNGGFSQFFTNTPEHIGIVVEALRETGCPAVAAIAESAIASLNILGPFTEARIEEALTDEVEEELDALDKRFFEYPDPIAERLLAYIEAHVEEVQIPYRPGS